MKIDILKKPLSTKELKRKQNKDGFITENLSFYLHELLVGNIDNLNELVSKRITGDEDGMGDISYKPISVQKGKVIISVTGYVADYIEWIERGQHLENKL